MSKEEDYFLRELKRIAPNLVWIKNHRPDFLKFGKTQKNLEIDFWNDHFKLGFEYQGGVHFKYIKRFLNDPDQKRYHDCEKYEMIKRSLKEYVIIEIFEYDLRGNIKDNLIRRINNTIDYYSKIGGFAFKIQTMKKFLIYINQYVMFYPKQVSKILNNPYNLEKRVVKYQFQDKFSIIQNSFIIL